MATNYRPAHGSNAQTTEFTVDLVALGVDRPDAPHTADVTISTDANGSIQLEIEPTEEFSSWQLDIDIVRGSFDILRTFRSRRLSRAHDAPEWVDVVIQEAERRVLEG